MRGIILEGAGMTELLPAILATAMYGLVVMTIATPRFRQRLD